MQFKDFPRSRAPTNKASKYEIDAYSQYPNDGIQILDSSEYLTVVVSGIQKASMQWDF